MPCLEYYLEKIPVNAPPAVRERMIEKAKRKVEEDTFGVGFQRDRHGKPIERGIGSPGNLTENHFAAIQKYEGKSASDRARAAARKAGADV